MKDSKHTDINEVKKGSSTSMKLGISSYTYTWSVGVPGHLPSVRMLELELLSTASQLGMDRLQIADNLPLNAIGEERLQSLLAMASQLNIGLEVGARNMTPEHLEEYIEIAAFLRSPFLRFVIDGKDFKPKVEKVVSIIKEAEAQLKEKNIILALENHDRLKATEFEEIIQKCGSDMVGICLDSVNSMGAGEGIETVTTRLAPYTVNLHVKEFLVSRHSHMMGFTIEGRPLGEGQLPLTWMLDQLTDRCQSATLELWTPPESNIEDTIEKEHQWALTSSRNLKTIIKK